MVLRKAQNRAELEQHFYNRSSTTSKAFFVVEIRQTGKENKVKECEPGSLQTYCNGLRRYFLQRPCPPAPDNFDSENFEEVVAVL